MGGCHDAEGIALDAGAELLAGLAAMVAVEVAATIQGVAADGLGAEGRLVLVSGSTVVYDVVDVTDVGDVGGLVDDG